jgi:hypothetical protein
MERVSVAQLQELVRQLPENKLPHAYRLLRDLAEEQGSSSPQTEFMQLPLSERRRRLAEQAGEMVSHYEQTASERQEWQSGDFQDEY